MQINEEYELHEILKLHKRNEDGKCSCGIALDSEGNKLLPDNVEYAEI